MKTLFLIILSSVVLQSLAYPEEPKSCDCPTYNCKIIAPLKDGTKDVSLAINSRNDWQVYKKGREVCVKRFIPNVDGDALPFAIMRGKAIDGLAGSRFVHKTDDGFLVAFNAGEFGAGIWWFSPDGTKRLLLSKEHVIGFVEIRDRILGVCGFSHLSISEGKILEFKKDSSREWSFSELVDLGEAAWAFTKDKDEDLLMVTDHAVLKLDSTGKLEVLYKKTDRLGFIYANSIVQDSYNDIYVGARYAVVRLKAENNGFKEEWLLP
ncbi:MAG: hypothetical protein PHQ96_06510 [Candidatus Omnitrophica bacterium]|nr:hypothetical protein [Candidatus Omnitrophota bacterium]